MSSVPAYRAEVVASPADSGPVSRPPQSKTRSGSSSSAPSGDIVSESFDMSSYAERGSISSSAHEHNGFFDLAISQNMPTSPQGFPSLCVSSTGPVSPLCSVLRAEETMELPWVLEVGVASDQGIRSTMEDKHVTEVGPQRCFFGIYDGHGGTQCAEYVSSHLHQVTFSHPRIRDAPQEAIGDAILQVEREFFEKIDEESCSAGCVCVTALVQGSRLTVGNVGDCEAVLSRAGKPLSLTVKHNPSSNEAEATRVMAAGGCIVSHRVGHPYLNPRVCSLAVSRAIGDAGFKLDKYTKGKPSGLIATADTVEVILTKEDSFLILACDGLWDCLSHEDANELAWKSLKAGADADTIADMLVRQALLRGTRDNVTVVFVKLGEPSR